MQIKKDGKGQKYLEWEIGPGGFKRDWISIVTRKRIGRRRRAPNLNVVRVEAFDKGPAGNATDFPIFSDLSDEQILIAFVSSICAMTGCKLPEAQ